MPTEDLFVTIDYWLTVYSSAMRRFLLHSASQTGPLELSPVLNVSIISQEDLSSLVIIMKFFTHLKPHILILVKKILCQSSWSWLSKLSSAHMNVFNLPFFPQYANELSQSKQDKNHTNFADILSEIVAVTSTLLWVWCGVPNSSVGFFLSPKTSK